MCVTDRGAAHGTTAAICGVSVSRTPLTCYNEGAPLSNVPRLHSVESSSVPTSPIFTHTESNSLKASSIKAAKWPSRRLVILARPKEKGSCVSSKGNTRRSRSFLQKQLQRLRSRDLNLQRWAQACSGWQGARRTRRSMLATNKTTFGQKRILHQASTSAFRAISMLTFENRLIFLLMF